MLDAPDADSCQILQVSGDFTGPLAGDASKRMVGLQCGMCLGLFPSCGNTEKMLRFQSGGCTAKWDWVLLCPDSEKRGSVSGINQTHVWFWFFFSPSEAEKWKFKREDSR